MRNILSLTAKGAREFFLKGESYYNFDLPPYFEFGDLLEDLAKHFENKELTDFYSSSKNLRPHLLENVNYKLISNKDGRYAWRPLQLIHPALYVYLVCLITKKSDWEKIKNRFAELMQKSNGIECEGLPVVSTYYKKDKAAQIIHWSTEVEKKSVIYSLDFDYLFHTDIVDCYGSIYTHSIAWALHEKDIAKKEKGNKKLLGNQIDWQLQAMSNGQTNGIPQGSILMDFLAEIVLCYIDSLLTEKIKSNSIKRSDYKIIRYRDDYRIFTNNPQIAEQIIKELTDILNDFGMRINSSKTKGLSNVIHSAIKPDKLAWKINENCYTDLQRELCAISVFSQSFPNSGQVSVSLKNFYDKIVDLNKKDINANIQVLISIVTDIAYNNPRTYPIAVAILSKLVDFLPKSTKERIVKKILTKFKKLPNTGIMQLWLQRITIKLANHYEYSEKLCNKVINKDVIVWNSDWLNAKTKKIVNSYNLINVTTLDKLGAVIDNKEVELFELTGYPF
ncbi:MAG: RNA-directed DNA polymerase [bacterium]|nr:RNA-directed DNA polymerase [bacterium]